MFRQCNSLKVLSLLLLVWSIQSKCSFEVGLDNKPKKVDKDPFLIQGMTLCTEYNGQMGCCNSGNDQQQINSYVEIDGVFSSLGGGCDICAINLKRFWCEYACSPRQSQFAEVQQQFIPVPNPKNPEEILYVQKVGLTIEAQTACDLFNACSRNQFVSAVSAMSTPAGFLTFQGHNAVNDATQYIQMKFSYQKNDSLYFADERQQISGKALSNCNTTTNQSQIHGFPFYKNCSCNNCGTACKEDQGYIYSETSVFQGFNYMLVGSTWVAAISIATIATILRNKGLSNQQSSTGAKKLI